MHQCNLIWKMEPIITLAGLHQVRPLLLKGLLTLTNRFEIPSTFLNELKKLCRQITLRSILNQNELQLLLGQMKDQGITAIPYKGGVLSMQFIAH